MPPLAVVAQSDSQSHRRFQAPCDMDPNLSPSSRLHGGPALSWGLFCHPYSYLRI